MKEVYINTLKKGDEDIERVHTIMVDFYNKIKSSVKYDKANFKNEIEDIMMKEQKVKLAIAERDNLTNEMPKNNPLLNF